MKVGDYVVWADHEDDDLHFVRPAGIILETRSHWTGNHADWGENYTEFLILLQHNGELSWEFGSDLVVLYESR
tara:strand:- start:31107 stop:31325 length:219 start_codon:yes stop_codon:yes gene_type:complete